MGCEGVLPSQSGGAFPGAFRCEGNGVNSERDPGRAASFVHHRITALPQVSTQHQSGEQLLPYSEGSLSGFAAKSVCRLYAFKPIKAKR
jgi:hypothetical protein